MTGVIAAACWPILLAWVGRHEAAIAKEEIRRWRDERRAAQELSECFDRVLAGRDFDGLLGGSPDDRKTV